MVEQQLKSFIETLRTNPRLNAFDEAATKQAIILPLLHQLGWNTYNIDEVTPEFSVENRRVDYSLRLSNTNEVFLEIKKAGGTVSRTAS
jgi:predicted type IV restriction endonuclease